MCVGREVDVPPHKLHAIDLDAKQALNFAWGKEKCHSVVINADQGNDKLEGAGLCHLHLCLVYLASLVVQGISPICRGHVLAPDVILASLPDKTL